MYDVNSIQINDHYVYVSMLVKYSEKQLKNKSVKFTLNSILINLHLKKYFTNPLTCKKFQ